VQERPGAGGEGGGGLGQLRRDDQRSGHERDGGQDDRRAGEHGRSDAHRQRDHGGDGQRLPDGGDGHQRNRYGDHHHRHAGDGRDRHGRHRREQRQPGGRGWCADGRRLDQVQERPGAGGEGGGGLGQLRRDDQRSGHEHGGDGQRLPDGGDGHQRNRYGDHHHRHAGDGRDRHGRHRREQRQPGGRG